MARVQDPGGGTTDALDEVAAQIYEEVVTARLDVLLLKGAGLARMLYADTERRKYWDIDLLARPEHLTAVGQILARRGYRNVTEKLGIDDVGGVVHADTWLGATADEPHRPVVELHRWLPGARAPAPGAWEQLWSRRTSIDLHGRQVPILDRDGQALQLATHAAQHGPSYAKGLRELLLGLERWPFEIWRDAAALAKRLDAVDAFAAGLRLVPPGAELAQRLSLPTPSLLEWEIRNRERRPRGTFHVEALREKRGGRERLRLVRRALVPDARWMSREYSWAQRSIAHLIGAYGLHAVRAPLWAARAWSFRRRARKADRLPPGPD